jgi:predicted transcriptional regulator
VNQIAIFERVMHALKAILPLATVSELRKTALSDLSLRTAQRYLKGLEQAGYIKRKDSGFTDESRFFLTDKAKQLFEVKGNQ